ncbi:MAG: hypothetical protein ACLQCU_09505 [Acidimicrobiales bacterium]
MTDETFEPVKSGEPIGAKRLERWQYSTWLGVLATLRIPKCRPDEIEELRAKLRRDPDLRRDPVALELVEKALDLLAEGWDARRELNQLNEHGLAIEAQIFGFKREDPRPFRPFRVAARLLWGRRN